MGHRQLNCMRYLDRVIVLIVAIAVWIGAIDFLDVSVLIIPTPWSVAVAGAHLVMQSQFWIDCLRTLSRTLIALGIGSAVGVPLGFLVGSHTRVRGAIEVWLDFLRSIPPVLFIPVFFLLMGISEGSRWAVGAYGSGLLMALATTQGIAQTSRLRMDLTRSWNLGTWDRFRFVVFWEALPSMLLGLRASLSLALVLSVVAEMMIGAPDGLGHRVYEDQLHYRIDAMYGAIIATGLLGFGLNRLAVGIERYCLHWVGQ